MKIAIIGWGSLIWNPGDLATVEGFEPGGPVLPIEFSRVSGNGRLTLVIDEAVGVVCQTYYAVSKFEDLQPAIENLRLREAMLNANGVGFVNLRARESSKTAIARHSAAVTTIQTWAADKEFDAAIWTALASNFHEAGKGGELFTVDAAIRYLRRLDEPTYAEAITYIRNAPAEVRTPVRTAVNTHWPI